MPHLDFYFSDSDRYELLEFIHLDGGELIPDLLYNNMSYEKLETRLDLSVYLKKDISHYFLLNDLFCFEPLVMSRNRFLIEEKYYINQRKGGPYIDFSFYTGFADDSTIPYKRSVIELYSKFIHYDSYEEFTTPLVAKDYYKKVTSFIRSKCKPIKIKNKTYFISMNVITELGADFRNV